MNFQANLVVLLMHKSLIKNKVSKQTLPKKRIFYVTRLPAERPAYDLRLTLICANLNDSWSLHR